MDIAQLKEYIVENNLIETILEDLQCKNIKFHSSGRGNYYTASNLDGDNKQAIIVYANESLNCKNYTRQMKKTGNTDLLDLVSFINGTNFFQSVKHVCSVIGIEYYHDFNEDIPESILITRMIKKMGAGFEEERDEPLKPISTKILDYYLMCVNDLFLTDNIPYSVQQEFHIGYDQQTNRITIPIYSEIGDLVGVKGRLFKKELDEDDVKYIYLEPTSRAKILYGLNKSIEAIKLQGKVYVFEAEKSVMQAYAYGDINSVATGGKEFSRTQIEMLARLGAQIILCLDKDVTKTDIENIANKFPFGVPIYYIFDEEDILNEKESPVDCPEKWEMLKKNNIYRIK